MSPTKRAFIIVPLLVVSILSFGEIGKPRKDKIQIAILLDVSGSMNQLILKAKSQFWRLSNYLGTATKGGKKPEIEFAIMTYGHDNEKDFCKLVNDFSPDVDSIAGKLYDIETDGGTEHCWTTIHIALEQLTWSKDKGDLKLIVMAGNESFIQETIDSKLVIDRARKMGVVINTIYCGWSLQDSVSLEWKQAAEQAHGSYSQISLKDSVNLKDNVLDNKLSEFNDKLNATYVPFGPTGQRSYDKMLARDRSSKMTGIPFFREWVIFKASESFRNPAWDLLDAIKADSSLLSNPGLLNGMTLKFDDRKSFDDFLANKEYMRESYKEAIRLRYEKIKHYLGESKGDGDLDLAIKQIVDKEGKKRNFEFSGIAPGNGYN